MAGDAIAAGTPAVIIAGRYADECGVVYRDVPAGARTLDVLIGSPRFQGERVTVRRTSVDLY